MLVSTNANIEINMGRAISVIDPIPLPFVKWAGDKRQLLTILNNAAPSSFNRYFEPSIGGGMVAERYLDPEIKSPSYNIK